MAVASRIEYVPTSDLSLDPKNPRLRASKRGADQESLLDEMSSWGIEEIAASLVENGFWAHEALIVVRENTGPAKRAENTGPAKRARAQAKSAISKNHGASIVVVEGNRRLAAVRLLLRAANKDPKSPKWRDLAARMSKELVKSLQELPTIMADSRSDVDFFLGFRHVTGIKQWEPHEKAEFIAKLVDSGLSYEEVMRRIGSKTPTVRQNYVAFKLFQQLKDIEGVDAERVREKFSVLFLSLRSSGTQAYLGVQIDAPVKVSRSPLPKSKYENAVCFARWMFGTETHDPLFTDSRYVDKFGAVLSNDRAVSYLERTDRPKLDVAVRLAGGDRVEVVRHIERASDEVEEVLGVVQHYSRSPDVIGAVLRLFRDIEALELHFPGIRDDEEK